MMELFRVLEGLRGESFKAFVGVMGSQLASVWFSQLNLALVWTRLPEFSLV